RCRRTFSVQGPLSPCATNILVITRQSRRVAQAALELCRSPEHRDLRTFISTIISNADLVARRASTPWKSRQHKRRRGAADRGEHREAAVNATPRFAETLSAA